MSAQLPADAAFTDWIASRAPASVVAEHYGHTALTPAPERKKPGRKPPVFTDRQIEIAIAAEIYREKQKESK